MADFLMEFSGPPGQLGPETLGTVARAVNSTPFDSWDTVGRRLTEATGMAGGDRATVTGATDIDTHTDPVTGATVLDNGVYDYSESPAGWERIADLDSQTAGDWAEQTEAALVGTGKVEQLLGTQAFYLQAPSGALVPMVDRSGYLVTITPAGTVERPISPSTRWGSTQLAEAISGEILARVHHDQLGGIREAFGRDGGHWVETAEGGLQRANKGYFLDRENVWGSRGLSIGSVDGEAIVRASYDLTGGVREAFGMDGGHFVETPAGLVRANDSVFARKNIATSYLGPTWTSGAQNLPFRPYTMLTNSLALPTVKTAYIFVGLGPQSNQDGQNNDLTDPLVSGAAVYPDYALMLEGTGGPRARLVTGNPILVPLVEAVVGASGSYQQETPTSGWVNNFIARYYAQWGEYPTVVGISAATGGRPYVGNNRGQESWRYFERALALAAKALRDRGFNNFEVVISYVGGESDTDLARMNDLRFANQMRQYRRFAVEAVRRAVSPVADPPVLMVQPSNVKNGLPQFQPVRDVLRRLDAEQGFTLVGPAYNYAMASGDTIHRKNLGKYGTGEMSARATMYEVLGATWHSIKPVRAYFSSATVITIEFDGMGDALVLDTSNAEVQTAGLANHGFRFDDGSGSAPAISSVAVSGQVATITLASAPTGPRKWIGYALQRDVADNQDGPITGARGTLRDNATYTRLSDGATQYDWCPAFILYL